VNAITTVPWHVYVTMFVFAVTIGLLAAFEVHDVRRPHVTGRSSPRQD